MWTCFSNLFLLVLIGSFAQAFDNGEVETLFRRGLEEYLKNERISDELQQALDVLQLPYLFRRENDEGIIPGATCLACNTAMDVLITARRNGMPKRIIINLLVKLCIGLKIDSEPVCNGAIRIQADSVVYIVDNRKNLTSQRVCSILLQEMGCEDPDRKDWTINIPPRKILSNTQHISESRSLKILQISDIHYDPGYVVGSNSACDDPLCCQSGSQPSKPEDAAGYWGDYRGCDIPWHILTDSLEHIVAQHKYIDYVYFTGDIINHKVWDTNISSNSEAISDVMQQLKNTFGNITIYPILGNHEPHPVNLFSSEGVDNPKLTTQWVFDLVAELWQPWLPTDTRETILRGGYYTVLVKPGFRIIALNSNVCYTFNWWLFYDDVDPFEQLLWLVQTLSNAEENGEIVHLLSHIPTGDTTCLKNWSKEYLKIINRFSHIIAAQFTGHTHKDQTVIFFNTTNSSEAIHIAFNGGSLTPYSNLNPNYKVYDVDAETMEVLDFESWTYNVTEANLTPELSPNWYKLYSFKNAYDVANLRPQEVAKLTERMAEDPVLTQLYFRYKYREADTALAEGCDSKCEIANLCYMVTSHPDNTLHCEIITDKYNSARPKSMYKLN